MNLGNSGALGGYRSGGSEPVSPLVINRRLDPPLANDPDRVALDEPLILDVPLARRVDRGDPDAEWFAWQQGRAARLPAAPVAEYTFGWEVPYDHWQERLGRTVLWAAGKLPAQPLHLHREPTTDAGSDAGSPPDSRLVVKLPPDVPIVQVRIRERRDDGLVVRDSLSPLPPDGGGGFVGNRVLYKRYQEAHTSGTGINRSSPAPANGDCFRSAPPSMKRRWIFWKLSTYH